MLKKTVLFGLVLAVCFSAFSVLSFARTDYQSDLLRYQAPYFPEEYKDLILLVPQGAYDINQKIDIKNVPCSDWGYGPEDVLIQELFNSGVFVLSERDSNYVEWENNPDAQKAPASEVSRVFEEIFGPGTFEGFLRRDYFSDYTHHFFYREDSDSYEYIRRTAGGGVDSAAMYVSFDRAETSGDTLSLYVRYASYNAFAEDGTAVFRLYSDARMRVSGKNEPYFTAPDTGFYRDLVTDGGLNEFLPVYKHTFRDNGVGGYYWASTEPVQKEDPEGIAALFSCLPKEEADPAVDLLAGVGADVMKDVPKVYEELLWNVPVDAYSGTDVFPGDSMFGLEFRRSRGDILMNALAQKGYVAVERLSMSDPVPEYRLAVQVLRSVYDGLFGTGSFDALPDRSSVGGSGVYMKYDEAEKDYYYVYSPWMGGVASESVLEWYEKSEEEDGVLRLYVRGGIYYMKQYGAAYEIYGSLKDYRSKDPSLVLASGRVPSESAMWSGEWNHLTLTEELRSCFPLYCHEFRRNEAGLYYWAGSSVAEEGKPIPETLHEYTEPVSSSDSETHSSDTSTDSVTDGEPSGPSSDIQIDPGPAENNLIFAVWVCAGVAAIALVCMFLPVIRKKCKKKAGSD